MNYFVEYLVYLGILTRKGEALCVPLGGIEWSEQKWGGDDTRCPFRTTMKMTMMKQ